jgi:hypothetical protein
MQNIEAQAQIEAIPEIITSALSVNGEDNP